LAIIEKKKMSHVINSKSQFACPSELDWYSVSPTPLGVKKAYMAEVLSTNNVSSSGPWNFRIMRQRDYIIPSRNYIHIEFSVQDEAGNALTDATKVAPVNDFLGMFFRQLVVTANGVESSNSGETYAYKATSDYEWGWHASAKRDTGKIRGYFEPDFPIDSKESASYKERVKWVAGSVSCYVQGPLRFELANQPKALPSFIDLSLNLHRNSDEFCLVNYENKEKKGRISIKSMKWYVQMWELENSTNMGLERALLANPAIFANRECRIKSFQIPANRRTCPENNLFNGRIPSIIFVRLVETVSFHGDFGKDPMNYQPHDVRNIHIQVNDQTIPNHPYNCSFEKNRYSCAFDDYLHALSDCEGEPSLGITYDGYKSGQTTFAFPIAPLLRNDGTFDLVRTGTLSVQIEFGNPTKLGGLQCVILALYDVVNFMDHNRYLFKDNNSTVI
jgi:hypothetical protein